MSESYARTLERVAGAIPGDPCVVALVPTIDPEHAAGLAGDVAQAVARGREGHTLLFSLEPAPARLDHEIGVEGGAGLVDVLEGRLPLARAAASGKARGFIYVPAGTEAPDGVDLAGRPAWRSLVESAVARRGTVLVFMPLEVLDSIRTEVGPRGRLDAIVWLGEAPMHPGTLPCPVAGALPLPGGRAAERPPAAPAGPSGRTATGGPSIVRGASRRARRERERRRRRVLFAVLILAFLATLALAAIAIVRPGREAEFLPQNDSLWLAPSGEDSSAS